MLETGPLPYLTIDSVTLTKNKVSVRAFLTTQQKGFEPFWLNENIFSQFIKIYFVLIDRKNVDQYQVPRPLITAATLQSPANRAQLVLSKARTENVPDIISWDTIITSNYPSKIISLTEAIESYENNVVVTPTLDMNSNNTSDIFFEVDIDNFSYEITPDLLGLQKLELVAFTHLDLAKLSEEFNLNLDDQVKQELIGTGGNMTYDSLLERGNDGKLFPPRVREILAMQDGTPYVGEYHRHTTTNPGPGGYIGFMGGPEGHPNMPAMPRLKVIKVPNNKIIARYFLDDSEFNSGYYGAPTSNILEDDGGLNLGTYPNYEPFTTSRMSLADENSILRAKTSEVLRKFYENPTNTPGAKIVSDAASWITIPEQSNLKPHHSIKFSLDFRSLIRSNSKYGVFIDLINQNGPISFEGQVVTEETLLSLTRIASIKVYRRRVSNSPRSNNPVGTPDWDKFDNDEIDRLLIQSADVETDNSFRKTLLSAANPPKRIRANASLLSRLGIPNIQRIDLPGSSNIIADIGEVPVLVDPNTDSAKYKRTFLVKDYELFQKINFGYYTYIVEVTIEDKIKNFILEKIARFENLLSRYKTFLQDASRIYIGKNRYFGADERSFLEPIERTPESQLESGNYIYESKRYTDNFKNNLSPSAHDENTRELIEMFDSMSRLVFNTLSRTPELEQSIIPNRGGNLEEGQLFEKNCQEILGLYYSFLRRDHVQQIGSLPPNSADYIFETEVKNTSAREPLMTTVKQNLRMVVKSFVDGSLMVSYGLDGSQDSAQQILDGIARTRQAQLDLEANSGAFRNPGPSQTEQLEPGLSTSRSLPFQNPGPSQAEQLERGLATGRNLQDPNPGIIVPKEFLVAGKGITESLIKAENFLSLPEEDKIKTNLFVNQVQRTDPSRSNMEMNTRNTDVPAMAQSSGISIGVPKLGSGIPKLKETNFVKTKAGDLQSGLVSQTIEKSMINLDTSVTGKSIIDNQKLTAEEETKNIVQDPRTLKASQIAVEISSGKKFSPPSEDLLLSRARTITTTGIDLSSGNRRKKRPKQKLTTRTRVDKAIESIREVVEVSVGKPPVEEDTVQVNDVAFVEAKKLEKLQLTPSSRTPPRPTSNQPDTMSSARMPSGAPNETPSRNRIRSAPQSTQISAPPQQPRTNNRTTTRTTPRRGGY